MAEMDKIQYLKDHGIHILIALGMIFGIEGVMILFNNTSTELIFIGVICLMCMSGGFIYDYYRMRSFYQDFETKRDQLDEKYLIVEMMDEPSFLEGRILFQSLQAITKSMNDEIQRYIRISNEFKQYVETWVHEIKLPIQALKLIVYNSQESASEWSVSSRRFREQMKRIDSYVEQVLYYIRSEVPQNDFLISRYSLKKVVDDAIKENRDSLILNQFSLEERLADTDVFTDEKWLSFILGQIISNSVKYAKTEDRNLAFYTINDGSDVQLVIEDHGVGISESDLPRIFEKSFTGKNGRMVSSSTGMGLYLCKKMCDELGHTIHAETVKGEYTKIIISLKAASN